MPNLRTTVSLASFFGALTGAGAQVLAAISLQAPKSMAGTYPGYFSTASAYPTSTDNLLAVVPAGDSSGCTAYTSLTDKQAMAVVTIGGTCNLTQKVAYAQQAGMQGMMVVSDDDMVNFTLLDDDTSLNDSLAIFVVGVPHSFGQKIITWDAAHADEPVEASVVVHKAAFPLLNPTTMLLVGLAVSLIAAGAWFSTADLRLGSPIAPQHEDQVLEITWWLPLGWVLGASIALVVLYFLMRWLIYVILFVFGMGGIVTMTEIGHACLRYRWPTTLQKSACTLPCVGALEFAQVIAICFGIANSAAWFFLRKTEYGWPFQNLIGVCFLCFFQRSIRLPNIKLAALLLSLMFAFDIFWVFISPMFFTKSVMVAVAMGGGSGEVAPMMLRIPSIGDPLAGDSMLGYGDIAIPGLLVSFLLRHDMLSYRTWRAGYFVPAVIGYGVGLCCALVGLYIMQMGQPALLYLVPGTLGTSMVLACKRGEVKALWEGTPCANPDVVRTMPPCKFCPGGHLLQPMPAPQGYCDGCKQRVGEGVSVMDCRACNWYLCAACRPQDVEESGARVES